MLLHGLNPCCPQQLRAAARGGGRCPVAPPLSSSSSSSRPQQVAQAAGAAAAPAAWASSSSSGGGSSGSGSSRRAPRVVAAAAGPTSQQLTTQGIAFHNPKWLGVETEAQFFALLEAYLDQHPMGAKLMVLWRDFYSNYKAAVLGSRVPGADEKLVAQVQASIADNVLLQFADPYTFPSLHQRMVTPEYSYFEFGQRYVASLTDFANSVVGHRERWDRAAAQLEAGENVVLLANHQTEADPGVFAHMLMSIHPRMAEEVVYVAGDRVVTDPMCKPFSMGRNLFCVHSKKHLNDIPELKASKMETNRKTLVSMQRSLNNGGMLIWIAPSGGRDRPNEQGEFLPDKFDPSAVELMRSLVSRAKKPGHIYPMAMFSGPMMPPPKTIDKEVGERRLTNWTPVGISLCEELDVGRVLTAAGTEDKEKLQQALAEAAHSATCAEFAALSEAIKDPSKRGPGTNYTQPWVASQTNAAHPPTRAGGMEANGSGSSSSGSSSSSSSSSSTVPAAASV